MFLIFFSYLIIINALLILIDALKWCRLQSDPLNYCSVTDMEPVHLEDMAGGDADGDA